MMNMMYIVKDWCGMMYGFKKEEKAREKYQKLITEAVEQDGMEVVENSCLTYNFELSAKTTLSNDIGYYNITFQLVEVED